METDLINRLFYKDSNSFRANEPSSLRTRNPGRGSKISYDFDSELNLLSKYNIKNSSNNIEKKFDFNSFNEYLEKLALNEDKKGNKNWY